MNKLSFKDYALRFMAPPKCTSCGARLPFKSNAVFCPDCGKSYYKNDGAGCKICGCPIFKDGDSSCARCKIQKIHFIKNISLYKYDGCVSEAIKKLKFHRQRWIAYELGKKLCNFISESYGDVAFDMILYVPMLPTKIMSRGFNQSGELARIVAHQMKIPLYHNILKKKGGGAVQKRLSKKARLLNVKGVFSVDNPQLIEDKTILLIDDIITTGATLNECSRLLKRNGALAVYCATLATTSANDK